MLTDTWEEIKLFIDSLCVVARFDPEVEIFGAVTMFDPEVEIFRAVTLFDPEVEIFGAVRNACKLDSEDVFAIWTTSWVKTEEGIYKGYRPRWSRGSIVVLEIEDVMVELVTVELVAADDELISITDWSMDSSSEQRSITSTFPRWENTYI